MKNLSLSGILPSSRVNKFFLSFKVSGQSRLHRISPPFVFGGQIKGTAFGVARLLRLMMQTAKQLLVSNYCVFRAMHSNYQIAVMCGVVNKCPHKAKAFVGQSPLRASFRGCLGYGSGFAS